ncbi:hypothetical protein [Nocardiopsis sp. TNDT3]|uniref:hypothetical protein n=1 Tax=Nocardiopsis sp. TNDT3 TaxID=2249354 RepID=UPI000E3C385A|nr:hypothetical protein [Nocardiopsis sp. TNDT3]
MRFFYGIFCAFSQVLSTFVAVLFLVSHVMHILPVVGNPEPVPEETVYLLLGPFGLVFFIGVVAARKIARGVNLAFGLASLSVAEIVVHLFGVDASPALLVVLVGTAVGACASGAFENMGSFLGFFGAFIAGYFLEKGLETSGKDVLSFWQGQGDVFLHVPMAAALVIVAVHVVWGFLTYSGEDDPVDTTAQDLASLYADG